MLDIDTTWNVRPALKADASGFHCLPDVNEGVSEDENRARPPARNGLGDTRFLRAWNHVVNEDARARCVRGAEDLQDCLEVVDALEELDRNACLCQVLSPHMLHEFGIMASLHPDTRTLGNLGAARCRGE